MKDFSTSQGQAGTGKTVLQKIAQGIVGKMNMQPTTVANLAREFQSHNLQRVHLITMGELSGRAYYGPAAAVYDEAMLQLLRATGGEDIFMEQKNIQHTYAAPITAAWISTSNNINKFTNKGSAKGQWWRRLVPIPAPYDPPDKVNTALVEQILSSELPGIMHAAFHAFIEVCKTEDNPRKNIFAVPMCKKIYAAVKRIHFRYVRRIY